MATRRGPAPNPNAVRRNKDHALGEKKLSDHTGEGRELPKALGISTAGAKRFWKTWASAPQTQDWMETDWSELEIVTKLVDAFYLGDMKYAGEIRQRVGKWGATTEDRARLRMSFDKSVEVEKAQDGPKKLTDEDMDKELFKLLSEG
ncbi:phage terminase small subunit [Streptomyces violascens]|uniref:phage terminase small subunit n=1 Tax=Streptomyces violascens TaxID=67381 RepID=UPI00365B5925